MMRSPVSLFCWSPQRLFATLKDSQAREKESWRHILMSDACDKIAKIGPIERDLAVTWMAELTSRFNFYPETFFLAVHSLDRFLHAVKSQPKYLKCIAVTALYIASKLVEEEECIPGTTDLVELSRCGCKPQDVLRMERIIVAKLEWDLHCPTPLTYLEIFHALAFSYQSNQLQKDSSSSEKHFVLTQHLHRLTRELQRVICNYALAPFPSAAIGLAFLSLEIELLTTDSSQWVPITSQIQVCAKIPTNVLMRCRDVLLTLSPRKARNIGLFRNPTAYLVNQCQNKYNNRATEDKNSLTAEMTGSYQGGGKDCDNQSLTIPVSDHMEFHAQNPDCNMENFTEQLCDETSNNEAVNELPAPELAPEILNVSQGLPVYDTARSTHGNTVTTYGGANVHNTIEACQNQLQPTTENCNEAFVSDHIDSGVSEDGDWNASSPQVIEEDVDSDGYDSDKTLTASEGEEEDYIHRKRQGSLRRRPRTYAEIVKYGIMETAA